MFSLVVLVQTLRKTPRNLMNVDTCELGHVSNCNHSYHDLEATPCQHMTDLVDSLLYHHNMQTDPPTIYDKLEISSLFKTTAEHF